MAELWAVITAHQQLMRQNNFFQENRRQQARYWLEEALQTGLQALFQANSAAQTLLKALEPEVLTGRISPFAAAEQVLHTLQK